ncbi:NUDIX hydrolase [Bacillus suaedae]|uniref:NUDIX domain-containing protein n=1 Tax=Halalkalibacter suaedae TaxID=2822140 RepID=A0A941ANF0_9BACI|nr:NUDIX domain-containing protein [Bacillus suaedae]MBP3951550.1 NUDIX domain-containing protein [Bacillus suaedae]
MENEQLKVFDDNKNHIGVATREEVHRIGYWHEVFHCWFVSKEGDTDYLLLQLRSEMKKDYPNLFDITAAGHLLASETVQDGVREIKEELGVNVSFNELVPLGVINYHETKGNFIDKEIANVFLLKRNLAFEDFTLQDEEVAGIVKVKFKDFADLWLSDREAINIKGFKLNKDGTTCLIDEYIGRDQFVSHPLSFYQTIVQKIRVNL